MSTGVYQIFTVVDYISTKFDRCLQESIQCLQDSIRYLQKSIRCLHESVKCLQESIRCLQDSIRYLQKSIRCLQQSIRCLQESIRCLQDSTRCLLYIYNKLNQAHIQTLASSTISSTHHHDKQLSWECTNNKQALCMSTELLTPPVGHVQLFSICRYFLTRLIINVNVLLSTLDLV